MIIMEVEIVTIEQGFQGNNYKLDNYTKYLQSQSSDDLSDFKVVIIKNLKISFPLKKPE